jgi:hypothetical protein
MPRYTPKQIEKYLRQKYITQIEKMAKNLFKMFRDESVEAQAFVEKFKQLKAKFDENEPVHLDAEYHREMVSYIERLYGQTVTNEAFDTPRLNEIREAEMSNLNRLQKMKNATSYKKAKHKAKAQNEDWG